MNKKSVVSIVKGKDIPGMIDETISLLGGLDKLIRPNATVVIKPNAGHPFPPDACVNTNPEVVTAIIKAIRKANPKEIILAEAAAVGCDTLECLEISGIGKAAEDAGVDKIIDIKREKDLLSLPIRDARSDLKRVLLPRFLVEADHIINVPIFKSHVSMVFTCALKNIKGVVQDKVHNQMHTTVLNDAILDLWSVVRADLTIADLVRPAEGFGPHATLPVDFGCIVAGQDPVAVDATVCRMVGLDTGKVAYFQSALDRKLGNIDEDLIEVRGKTIEEVYQKLWLPYMQGLDSWPEYNIYADNACSSCLGLLAYSMESLKAIGEYDKNAGISIVVGAKKKLPEGVKPGKDLIIMGECTRRYKDQGIFLGNCPPLEPVLIYAILDRKAYEGAELRSRHSKALEALHDYALRKKNEEK